MLKLCNINIDRSEEVFDRIARYREKVVRELNPGRIILFGSFARGDFNEGSDVDLIVVADWKQDFLDRTRVLLDMNEFHLPLEAVGYTEDEFERMAREGNRFIGEVITTGKVIYRRQNQPDPQSEA